MRQRNEYNVDIGLSGTSATLIIILNNNIYYGYVGDSLACLSKEGFMNYDIITNSSLVITQPFHFPDEPKEKLRIYSKGGEIRRVNQPFNRKKFNDEDKEID